MTITRTTLLDLPIITTGTESGVWGDITNKGLTQYLDIAIAGMTSLTSADFTAGALTIETTEGDASSTNITSTSAQYAGFRVSSLATNSTITVGNTGSAVGRSYRIINADSTYTLTFKATGQTGVTFQPGTSGLIAFNGTDYVLIGMVGPATATDNAVVRFDGTSGRVVQNSAVTIADTTGDITTSGYVITAAGAAGTAAYTTSGDLNTGMFFPAADTLAFTEGGTEVMRIDSSGNVGIGTTSAGSKLDVKGTLRLSGSSSGYVGLAPAAAAGSTTYTLPSADGTSGQFLSTNGGGVLSWATASGGGGGGGTSTTTTQFTATGGQTTFSVTYTVGQISVYMNGALLAAADYTATNGTSVVLASGATAGDIVTVVAYSSVTSISQLNTNVTVSDSGSNGTITFTTDGTEVMRATSSQTIGIGTTTARGKLTVSDGAVNTAGEAVFQAYIAGTSRTPTSDVTGMLTIQSTNALAANVGGSIVFGGRAVSGSDAGANWASIAGFKENATTGNYAGYLQFGTRSSGGPFSERMRIDSSGNLGLGSTSPSTFDDANGGRNFVIQSTGAGRGVITFASQQTSGADELLGRINFIDSDSTNTNYRGAQIDGLLGSDANSAYLRFNTANSGAGTERMRITQTGSVLINSTNTTPSGNNNIKLNAVGQMMFYGGTTTQSDTAKGVINFSAECNSGSNNEAWANYYPGVFMDVQVESGNDGFANSALMIRGQRGGATNPGPLLRMGNGNRGSSTFNQVFRVLVDNGAVANSTGVYGSLSDVRLKQDITDASSQWDDIKAVRIRKFRMKSDFELAEAINAANPGLNWTPPYYIGAIAQEIEQVSPGLIEHEGGEENLKVIKYSILYMKAIKALQEAMARIETLEADVAALKAR